MYMFYETKKRVYFCIQDRRGARASMHPYENTEGGADHGSVWIKGTASISSYAVYTGMKPL